MADDPGRDDLNSLAARIIAVRGGVVVPELSDHRYLDHQAVIDRVRRLPDDEVDVRLVLGSASTTAAKAIDQFVAALQLPYEAAQGWGDFIGSFGERTGSGQQYVIVADAAELLKHEDVDLWRELIGAVCKVPSCLLPGWTTLVLADQPYRWTHSRFGTAAAAQAAASRFNDPQ
jgi:hypothetical protein